MLLVGGTFLLLLSGVLFGERDGRGVGEVVGVDVVGEDDFVVVVVVVDDDDDFDEDGLGKNQPNSLNIDPHLKIDPNNHKNCQSSVITYGVL